WDGYDENGEKLPLGFYKVKVFTDEDSNWDEEYAFDAELNVIPRKYLRSPFTNPSDTFPIGTDLSYGILSGLYPTYYDTAGGTPYVDACHQTHRMMSQDLKLYYIQEIKNLGLTDSEANLIVAELEQDGFINSYGVMVSDEVIFDLTPPFNAYNSDVEQIVREFMGAYNVGFDWEGHCYDIQNIVPWDLDLKISAFGGPVYEGPVEHGMLPDGNSYFNGKLGSFCRCGDPLNASECDDSNYTSCQLDCPFLLSGDVCGEIGYLGEHWDEGLTPVVENLKGYLYAPIGGTYNLQLVADDLGSLTIGGTLTLGGPGALNAFDPVITGGTSMGIAFTGSPLDVEVDLPAGYHPIEIGFENTDDIGALRLLWNLDNANNQNFIFIDPTFIQENHDDPHALDDFMDNSGTHLQ
ncbi:MAG: hypothetical protein KAR31_03695, partial [Candidatus Omnitrophica bacterium]|nr:hypothetical protein [Candidatus Omnitrophota bacterium]